MDEMNQPDRDEAIAALVAAFDGLEASGFPRDAIVGVLLRVTAGALTELHGQEHAGAALVALGEAMIREAQPPGPDATVN